MKISILPAVVLSLTACAGSMAPYDLDDFVSADVQFAPAAPRVADEEIKTILAKESLSLHDLVEIADAMNPELAAERQKIDIATAALWEAQLYPNPSATIGVEDYRTRDGLATGRTKRKIGLSLPLALWGRIGAATAVADKEREIAAVAYIWRRREILTNVKDAFIRAIASRQELELAHRRRDLSTQFRRVAKERFDAQTIPEMELLKTEIELDKAESDLRNAEKDVEKAFRTLRVAVGLVDLPDKRYEGAIALKFGQFNVADLRAQISSAHPLVIVAELAKSSAELQCEQSKSERFADPNIEIAIGKDPEDDAILEGGLTIPIPLFNRNQAKIAAADARVRQTELAIGVVRRNVLSLFDEACSRFASAQERANTYAGAILPKAQKALDLTNEGYAAGKFGYLELLDAQRTLLEATSSYTAALTEMNLAAAEIEKLTGRSLEPLR